MVNLPYAVVGGGLMGASLAYHLASCGKAVILIDDDRVGRASNWNPGGVNPLHGPGFPDVMQDIYRQAYEIHCSEHQRIRDLSGIEFNWKVVKRLFLAKNAIEMNELANTLNFYREMPKFSASLLDRSDLKKFDDRISRKLEGGLLTIGNVSLNAERFRLALLAAAVRLGAKTYSGTLLSVTADNGKVKKINFGFGDVPVMGICMALGAWSNQKIAGWDPGYIPQIKPLIGDLLFVSATGRPLNADIGNGLRAAYQHDSNHYWLGGTTRTRGILGACTEDVRRDLLSGIKELIPGWTSFNIISQSSAARPVNKNGLPVLGPTPSYSNGWIMNGGGSKGVLLSLWMGKTLSEIMITDVIPENLIHFLPKS